MFQAISNLIVKGLDNQARGLENATKAGEGSKGQNYQIANSDTSVNTGTPVTTASAQDTSGTDSIKASLDKIRNVGKDLLSKNDEKKEDGTQEESPLPSDERLKNIFGDNEDAIKCFAKIDAIKFTYNDKAKELDPTGDKGVDDDIHYGIKAQDLERNPLTKSAVTEDEKGNKLVDIRELTTANSAVISEICKRIEIIENILGIKVV